MSAQPSSEFQAALQHCAREPVRTPGTIQPAGCLIALDDAFTRITHVSANIDVCLGIDPSRALNRKPQDLLGGQILRRLRKDLEGRDHLPSALSTSRRRDGHLRRYRVFAYRSGAHVVVEFEHLVRARQDRLFSRVNDWLSLFAGAQSTGALLDTLVEAVRSVTGYDRVMVYAFDPDWHGTVVAESRVAEVGGFLGHRFPASDIPPQVRALYDINPVRVIPDATAAAVPLIAAENAGENALDLSPGVLRGVSPVHLVYLRNLGVRSAFSVAMHSGEGLWGLLAAHSPYPRLLSPALRDAARTLAQTATQRLCLLRARDQALFLERVRDSRGLLADVRGRLRRPGEIVQSHGQDWLNLFRACGCALVHGDNTIGIGRIPDDERLDRIVAWLDAEHQGTGVWQSRRLDGTGLADLITPQEACGLLAIPLPLSEITAGWLLLFRAETIESYKWAGDPTKGLVREDGEARLSARRSFETWREEVAGQSAPWTDMERHAAIDLAEDLAVAVSAREISIINDRLRHEHEALAQANERLKDLAHTDPLTRVWNRYRIEAAIDTELGAAKRYERPCSLLLFDVDHFKRVNDTHGHDAGDRVLVEVARVVSRNIRDTDHLGRWGGEEFVVLATNSDLEAGECLAERLRRALEGIDFGEIGTVTASFGVAAGSEGDTRRSLVDRADRAMYRAKESGRNRVVSERSPDPASLK